MDEHDSEAHQRTDHGHGGSADPSEGRLRVTTSATLHCLLGCGLGEVVGVVIGVAIGLSAVWTLVLAVVLGFVFGFAWGIIPLLRAGFSRSWAIRQVFVAAWPVNYWLVGKGIRHIHGTTGTPRMMRSASDFLHLGFGLVCLGVGPLGLGAQQAGEETRNWAAKGEVGGNAFFGNTSQSALTAALSGDMGRGFLRLNGRTGFAYGRATNEAGEIVTNKRAWDMAVRLDFDSGSSAGAFIVSKVESIFEKKIDLRYSAGAGGKYGIGGDGIQAEFNLALLVEKTIPHEGTGVPEEVVAKWAAGFRLERATDGGRVRFETVTSVEPEVREVGVFTLTSRSSLAFQLSQRVGVQFSFVDSFDSEARSRGAQSNNDGQIFFGVVGTF